MITNRRQVLKILGASGALALAPLSGLARAGSKANAAAPIDPSAGELYGGFLLLPNGTPPPASIKAPRFGIPVMCTQGQGQATAMGRHFGTHGDVRANTRLPLYTPRTLPANLQTQADGGDVIEYEFGAVFAVQLDYKPAVPRSDVLQGSVTVWAQADFPRPFPMWFGPDERGGNIQLEKVDFLPAPGLQVATPLGYVFHWIKDDVYYSLRVENNPSRADAQAFASSLAPLS